MKKSFTYLLLIVVLSVNVISCSKTPSDPYRRIIVAHRAAQVSYEGILKKSIKWDEPEKSALLSDFSEENLTIILIDLLKIYVTEKEAYAVAEYVESPEGQKMVAYGYGEYDLDKITETERKKIKRFGESSAGVAYKKFTDHGLEKYHDVIRVRAKKIVDTYRK
jgi:hypothetical protein